MPHARALRLIGSSASPQRPDAGETYERLFQLHWGPLVRYARGIVRSADGAEDIVQEAFLGLWQRREAIDPERVKAFLYRAVRNRSFNERRWSRVRDLWRDRQAGVATFAPPGDEEEAADRRVMDAVATLPRRRREVFELARYHDMSYEQIADTLSISPQTVANHMSAALRDLRRALADLIDEDGVPRATPNGP
jgi:RNA polymerase sigma-70 factor (ECF subfamily)